MLNWFEKWMLRGIAKKLARQGGQNSKIQEYYSYMIRAAKKEYTEDNDTTLRHFLEEMHSVECNKQFLHAEKKIFKRAEVQDRVVVEFNRFIFSAIVTEINGAEITVIPEFSSKEFGTDETVVICESHIKENKGTF